jgi:peroxiredoxin
VVLYFFPKAFTSGCTAEAHDFADHIAEYQALHATVIGISGDGIATQVRFSTLECRSRFLVAADPALAIAKSYDAVILGAFADRTSYVIARDGTIAYTYTDLDPDKHVANTLAALRRL